MEPIKIKNRFYQATDEQWDNFCGALQSRCSRISDEMVVTPNYVKITKDKSFIDSGFCIYAFATELIDGHAVQKLAMNEYDTFLIVHVPVKFYGITVSLVGHGNVHIYDTGKAKIFVDADLEELLGETFNVSTAISAHLDYSNDLQYGEDLGYHVSIPIQDFSLEEKAKCLEHIESLLKLEHKLNQEFLLKDCIAIELWVEKNV